MNHGHRIGHGHRSTLPFILVTAFIHCPRVSAPLAGLYWRVSRPNPTRRSVFPHRTLQDRQVQSRLAGEESSSCPLTWPTSTVRLDPHSAQMRGPSGGHALARYLKARSVAASAVSLRLRRTPSHDRAEVSPRRCRLPRPYHRGRHQSHRYRSHRSTGRRSPATSLRFPRGS